MMQSSSTLSSSLFPLPLSPQKSMDPPSSSLILHPTHARRELRTVILEAIFFINAFLHPEPHFDHLPTELLHIIASKFTTARDLVSFSLVNKSAYSVVRQETSLWEDLCCRTFATPRGSPRSWRELFQFNHTLFREIASQAALRAVAGSLAMAGGQIMIPPVGM